LHDVNTIDRLKGITGLFQTIIQFPNLDTKDQNALDELLPWSATLPIEILVRYPD